MEQEAEAGGEGRVEIVARPGHPVMAVEHIGISVVPRPPKELDTHDIEGDVEENDGQASCR